MPISNTEPMDRKVLLDYFLGEMDTASTEELESKMFEDNDLFYELVDFESEIADAYLNGSLEQDTRKKLEKKAAANAGFAEKLRNAKALRSHSAHSSLRVSDDAGQEPREGWFGRMMARTGLSSFSAPAIVTAVLLVFLVGLAAFLIYDRIRVGNEIARIKADQQANTNTDSERIRELERQLADVEKRERDLRTGLKENQGQSEILQDQLTRERSERENLQRELNRVRNRDENRGTAPAPRIATLILSPFALARGPGGGVKTISLPAGVERLSITLQLPITFEGGRFTVTFKGKTLASDAAARTRSGVRYVVVSMPAGDVSRDGDNVLRLASKNGESVTYVFRVAN